MAPRDVCAWGGCDMTPRHGEKYCPAHRDRASAPRPDAAPDLFSDPTPAERAQHFKARASLPEALAEPIMGKASTSKRAAEAARAGYKSRKLLIHETIKAHGATGLTRPEIAAELAIGVNSVNSACNTLYRQGYIGTNPGHERPDPTTGVACAVLVDEAHVERWKGRPRASRSSWEPITAPPSWTRGECDLVHPLTGNALTEREQERDSAGWIV